MELLKTLKLVKYERTGQIDAVELRRHKLIVKINEQIDLATNANTKVSERFVVKDNEGDELDLCRVVTSERSVGRLGNGSVGHHDWCHSE